ncbi:MULTISPECIES: alpha/beta fold hydrolase [unclassified Luteococcus]|uniref:alpha/beta fold hydrolase n=1 Tax=unclassified Luteococcus TaxID=2639923 RepID=UPI00313D0941
MGTPHPQIRLTPLAGDAEQPLLLLGPSMGTSGRRLWGGAAQLLSGHHVVAWDLPGHGGAPAHHHPLTLPQLAEAVLTAVDAQLGAGQQFHVAGDSIGGAVALLLALHHPERVATSAALCSGSAFGGPQAWLERAALVRREGIGPVLAGTPARWFGSRAAAWPENRRQEALTDLANVDVESYARLCEALADYDIADLLPGITPPVLCLAGADDPVSPPEAMRRLAQRVGRGSFRVLEGVGHLAPLEAPRETAAALLDHVG